MKLYVPDESTFPIPLKYIDVKRRTLTDIDSKDEQSIDDYWSDIGERKLTGLWSGKTIFTLLRPPAPPGHGWVEGRLTKLQKTSRPDNVWPEIWKVLGKAQKRAARKAWAIEKPLLEAARQRRGIFEVSAEDLDYHKCLSEARSRISIPKVPAMPTISCEQECSGSSQAPAGTANLTQRNRRKH